MSLSAAFVLLRKSYALRSVQVDGVATMHVVMVEDSSGTVQALVFKLKINSLELVSRQPLGKAVFDVIPFCVGDVSILTAFLEYGLTQIEHFSFSHSRLFGLEFLRKIGVIVHRLFEAESRIGHAVVMKMIEI
jgi:hypothetical protein